MLVMADAAYIPDEAETRVRVRWGGLAWSEANAAQAKTIIARYPPGRPLCHEAAEGAKP